MGIPIAIRLAVRQWLARPLRPVLCSLAIAAAVALIVCVGTGFDSLRYSLRSAIGQMLGVADMHVRPSPKGGVGHLSEALLAQIRARPDVQFAAGRMQAHIGVKSDKEMIRWFEAVGVDPKWDEKLRPKKYADGGSGHPLSGAPDELVLDSGVAQAIQAKVGDEVQVTVDATTMRRAKVVGIVKRPSIELVSKPTVYLPIQSLAKDLMLDPQYNVIDVKLRDSANLQDYDAYALKLGKELGPTVQVTAGTNSQAKLTKETQSIQIILSLLATISAICAALIIGTTLSVGVQERVRQFGQLRCIGASRRQLVAFLLGDALVMLLLGEVLGIILGFVLSGLLVWHFAQFFTAYRWTWSSLLIAVFDGCGATLLGAAVPAWQVTRVTPMAAVAVVAKRVRRSHVWMAAVIGGLCLALQVLLWVCIPSHGARFFTYMLAGAPLIFLGIALLGPMFLTVFEAAGAAVIGPLLRVRPALLRSAWSSTPWRAGAMVAALMIGVTLLTAVRARGQSLLASFVSPARLPDILMQSVADSLGLFPSKVLPDPQASADKMKASHPEISDITSVASYSIKVKGDFKNSGDILNVDTPHFVAVDPESFPRLVELQYIQGNPQQAIDELKAGGHIFVTRDFYNVRKLGVGDKLTIMDAKGNPVDFTISAVVTSTGMELVKNYFDMRSLFQDHALTSVMGTLADARKYFKNRIATVLLANLKPGLSADQIAKFRQAAMQEGFPTVSSLELKNGIRSLITGVVHALSILALAALAVASLGVANMVIASVHARRYEFGVLRAIGSGRGQLIRLVLAEVTLIGIIAGVLGAAAGLYLTYMATAVDQLLLGFQSKFLAADAGDILRLIGLHIALAIGLTTLLAWLASIGPAVRGAFTAQRSVLASGRV